MHLLLATLRTAVAAPGRFAAALVLAFKMMPVAEYRKVLVPLGETGPVSVPIRAPGVFAPESVMRLTVKSLMPLAKFRATLMLSKVKLVELLSVTKRPPTSWSAPRVTVPVLLNPSVET